MQLTAETLKLFAYLGETPASPSSEPMEPKSLNFPGLSLRARISLVQSEMEGGNATILPLVYRVFLQLALQVEETRSSIIVGQVPKEPRQADSRKFHDSGPQCPSWGS